MQAAIVATVISTLASTYFTYDNMQKQKKAQRSARDAANYQAALDKKAIQETLAEQRRRSKNLLAQQQSAYKAKLGASGLGYTSGSGQMVLDNMQKEHDVEDKYLQEKANISLETLRNSIERINTQNLLNLKTTTNNQVMSLINGLGSTARQMLK